MSGCRRAAGGHDQHGEQRKRRESSTAGRHAEGVRDGSTLHAVFPLYALRRHCCMHNLDYSRSRPMLAVGLSMILAVVAPAHAQQPPPALTQFLRQTIALDAAQLAMIERGEAVVKVLDTQNKRDVAVFGIVTADAPRESYIRQLRDFEKSLQSPVRARVGIFSDPVAAADVQTVTLDRQDAEDLRKCQPGKCDFKLPATEMQRIRERVDWSAGDQRAPVTAYARQRLLDYATDYRGRGDSAMVVYDDRGNVRSSDAFADLLAQSPYVYRYAPSLARYLSAYPRAKLDGVSDVLFWSETAAPRMRRTLTVTHLAVYSPPELPGTTLAAAKQIYANHYFEAAFDLTTIVDRHTADGSSGIYLIVLRRFRFDNLPSGGLLNIRGKVVGSLRDQMLGDLPREKAIAEQARTR